jgi:hypothetical protein
MNQPTLFDSELEHEMKPKESTPFRDVKYLVCKRYKQDISKREIQEVYLLGYQNSIIHGNHYEHITAKVINSKTKNEFTCYTECLFNTIQEAEYAKNNLWLYKD